MQPSGYCELAAQLSPIAIPLPRQHTHHPAREAPERVRGTGRCRQGPCYLLSSSHPKGRDKRRLFRKLGFDDDRWLDLVRELLRAGRDGEVVKQVSTIYGTKYVIDAVIAGPGATGLVRTVWMLERGHAAHGW